MFRKTHERDSSGGDSLNEISLSNNLTPNQGTDVQYNISTLDHDNSSSSSSESDSESCIVLKDDDNLRMQRTMQLTMTDAALYRQSELQIEKQYESASESLQSSDDENEQEKKIVIEKDQSLSSSSESIEVNSKNNIDERYVKDNPVVLLERDNLVEGEYFEERIIKRESKEIEVVREMDESRSLSEDEVVEDRYYSVDIEKKSNLEEKDVVEDVRWKDEKVAIEEVRVEKKNNDSRIRNSLTEMVMIESRSKPKKNDKSSSESCSKCFIF
ncbi:hypothetical protein SteCoe_8353 [Stentor coeruleus]|uniref:Uncharacterized protein n=1 Tax=Stentor coeruleus TaxID=5963 RepID=A0A1R2CKA9_9CILI|nr:hypothetical protein SteCoe_8353 [Stentor coeruleus]